jgi:hypothetical protein
MKWLGGEMGQDDRHGCSGGWRTLRLFYGTAFAFGERRAGEADKWRRAGRRNVKRNLALLDEWNPAR